VETPNKKTTLVAGVAVAGIVTTAALAAAVWPALTRPDPPAEASGDGGLRISLVQPPKALVAEAAPARTSLLDVGLSEAAQAMAKGREALFVRTAPVRPQPKPARIEPVRVAQVDEDEEDFTPPPEPVDDHWEREAWRRDRFEEARRRRWEEEQRWARRERQERAAWEQAQRDRDRWEDDRRYEDRYAPPPPEDAPPPSNW